MFIESRRDIGVNDSAPTYGSKVAIPNDERNGFKPMQGIALIAVGIVLGAWIHGRIHIMSRFIPKRIRSFYGRRKHKKFAVLATILPLLFTGSALAYFLLTVTGTYSGSATAPSTGTVYDASNLQLSISGLATLTPGGSGANVVINAPAGGIPTGHYLMNKPTFDIAVDAAHVTAGCDASWYHVDMSQLFASGGNVFPYSFTSQPSGAYIGNVPLLMTDTASNQNACQGATITVTAHNS